MLYQDSLDCEEQAVVLGGDAAVVLVAVASEVPGSVPSTFLTIAGSKQLISTPDEFVIGMAKHCVLGSAHESSLNDPLAASQEAIRVSIHAIWLAEQATQLVNRANKLLSLIACSTFSS